MSHGRHERDARAYIFPYPGGHLKSPPPQQMHVQVEHRLAGARPHVQHRAVAVFDAALAGPREPPPDGTAR